MTTGEALMDLLKSCESLCCSWKKKTLELATITWQRNLVCTYVLCTLKFGTKCGFIEFNCDTLLEDSCTYVFIDEENLN